LSKIFRIKVHFTWIFVFALVIVIVTTQFSEDYPLWQRALLSVAVALLFLLAAIMREFILILADFRKDAVVREVTLFAFGGVYQKNRDIMASTHWPLQYFARYLSNLVIALIFYGLYATFISTGNTTLAGLTQWLTFIYFLLFLLNFIPAYPLDGGAILRMILWKTTGDYYKATRIVSLIGWAVGLFLIFAGVLLFIVTLEWNISLVIVAIGWFIQIAAGNTRRQVKTLTVLQPVKAQDILTREYPVMSPQVNMGQLIREHILAKGWHYVIVMDGTKLKGILTLSQIQSVPGKLWANTSISDIMTKSEQARTASPQQSAASLFEEMDQYNIDYIPVLENENLVGVVSRDDLISLVKIRSGFGV
jgi:CBS domain-containing protein